MKLFKTVLAATAVAAILSSCTSADEATTEELADKGITKNSLSIYNGMGKGYSAIDAVNAAGIKGTSNTTTGYVDYAKADSAKADFKTLNNMGRASFLTERLISLNGTKYAPVDSADFDKVTKSIATFAKKLRAIADTASSDSLKYTASTPYFVAKLGQSRGYCLAHVTSFAATATDSSSLNTGKVDVEYYYISKTDADATYKE